VTLEPDNDDHQAGDATPSDELYLALGTLVFNFGLLEEALRHGLLAAFDNSDDARLVLTGLSFRQLVERFGAIHARFRYEPGGALGVAPLCAMLGKLNEERNREIHATWGFWADSGHPVRTRERIVPNAGLSLAMESVSPAVLVDLSKRMLDATDLVWQVRLDFARQRRPAIGDHDTADGL
jgi:hypothetical protein